MIELTSGRYEPVAAALCPPSTLSVEVRSVLAGLSSGRVFADRREDPGALLVWSHGMEGVYLAGTCFPAGFAGELEAFAAGQLRDLLAAAGYTSLEISGTTAEADQLIQTAFAARDLHCCEQWVYRSKPSPSAGKIDGETLPVLEAVNLRRGSAHFDLGRSLERFWGDRDGFAEHGLGYCSVVDGAPVSVCMSAFVDGRVHCVELETAEGFRRQGHATAAASRFVAECQARGLTVHWDCTADNEASWRTACRCGLLRVVEYRCWCFEL